MSQQPPAQPKSVLRGHRTQVHATTFVRDNQRLASGDSDGFVVLWDLTIMRPRAVWRAHAGAILGILGWGHDKLITEGRDNRLIVWKIAAADEENLSIHLPLDESAPERPQPWILHILEINTMNFCSFAQCSITPEIDLATSDEVLLAVPNTLATEAVDIFHLPSQTRQGTVHLGSKTEKKGMVMALSLFWRDEFLFLVAGYENGLAVVARRRHKGAYDIVYKHQAHSQPILSLDVAPDKEYFLTSGADTIIAKHPIPHSNPTTPLVPVSTKITTTPGSDGKGSEEPPQQPANLSEGPAVAPTPPPRGLPKKVVNMETSPLKVINTKHSGQQGLQVRSDGRIFATAGWDSKIRVYAAKTMTELAVLKWHDVGCYAAAFASLDTGKGGDAVVTSMNDHQKAENQEIATYSHNNDTAVIAANQPGEPSVKDRRIKMAKEAHWLAAGSKDGKISLWDIY